MVRRAIFSVIFFWSAGILNPSVWAAPLRVLFLGDSITIGYGLKREEAYPHLVQEILKKEGTEIEAINGGVSGDTTAGGWRRIKWMMRTNPGLVVIALGGNDMLRGLPPEETQNNLLKIIEFLQQSKIPSVLFGMKALSNYGPRYEKSFNQVFDKVAKQTQVAYLPFFISSVATKSQFNQADGIHPNREGQKVLAAELAKFLGPEIRRIRK